MPTADIFADSYWNETGIRLVAGSQYKFSVVPGVGAVLKDASFTARSIAGEEWRSLPHKIAELVHGKRQDDARWFALIGTIDREQPFVIEDGGAITAPSSGELVCYFNDVQFQKFYENNKGWIRLLVEQTGSGLSGSSCGCEDSGWDGPTNKVSARRGAREMEIEQRWRTNSSAAMPAPTTTTI